MINVVPWRRQQMQDGLVLNAFNSAASIEPENVEEAIARCYAALTVSTREADPQQWALLQYNLGDLYKKRVTGKRHENLERAMYFYQCALQVHTYTSFPVEHAVTQMLWCALYLEIGTNTDENSHVFEQVLQNYQQTLQIFTEDTFPVQWAISQQNISYVYLIRKEGDQVFNVQQAIIRAQSSLRILTRAAHPVEWATTHAYLGEAYRQATCHATLREHYSGRSVMQEQALRHITAALQVLTLRQYPLAWARVQRTLGVLYIERVRGQRDENLAQARDCYKAALQVFSHEFSPIDCTVLQILLTSASLLVQSNVTCEG